MKRPTPEAFEYIFVDVTDPIFGAQLDADDLVESFQQMLRGEGITLHPSPPSPDELQ